MALTLFGAEGSYELWWKGWPSYALGKRARISDDERRRIGRLLLINRPPPLMRKAVPTFLDEHLETKSRSGEILG